MTLRKILLLDADPSRAGAITARLEALGYQATTADPRSADALAGPSPDVVLLDGTDRAGSQLHARAHELQARFNAPVLLLGGARPVDAAQTCEPWRLIAEPSDSQEWARAIEYAVSRADSERQLGRRQRWLSEMGRYGPWAAMAVGLDGRVQMFNPAASKLISCDLQHAINRPFDELLRVEEGDLASFVRQCCQSHETTPIECGSVVLLSQQGERRFVEASCMRVNAAAAELQGVLILLCDTSEMVRAQQEHAEQLEQIRREMRLLQSVLAAVPAPVLALDRSGRLAYCSQSAAESFGLDLRQAVGCTPRELGVPVVLRKAMHEHRETVLITGKPISGEAALETPHGLKHFEFAVTPARGPQGRVEWLVYTARDVTERKDMERQVLYIAEQERRRLAQELHDGLNQHLLGVTLCADVLQQKLLKLGLVEESGEAGKLAQIGRLTIEEARRVARGLCPLALEQANLVDSLENLAREAREMLGIACESRWDGRVLVQDREVATQLYRIAQEALNNAVKHGRAKKVTIELIRIGSRGRLIVQDDGVGIGERAVKSEGMGIRLMRYRASTIRGHVRIEGRQPHGSVVTCAFPLPMSDEKSPRSDQVE